MRADIRTRLYCYKYISNGKIIDRFEVVVLNNEASEWKKFYEDLGYTVSSVR